MQKKLEQFSTLFNFYPAYKVLDVTTHTDEISQYIFDKLFEVQGRLALVKFPGSHQELHGETDLTLQEIEDFETPFRALPRDNDIVMIRDVVQNYAQLDSLLMMAYRTLANAGELIILTSKDSLMSETIYEAIDKADFRAVNTIELFDDYELIMAKKMHMWGNGL